MASQLFHIKTLFKRLGIVLLLFTICRVLFILFNYDLFPSMSFLDLLVAIVVGARFDIAALILINSLYILFHIIPNPWREKRWYQTALKAMFYAVNGFFIFLEAGDFIYYEFAQQRTSSHIFGLKNDIIDLIPQFLKDFWYVLIACLGVFICVEWLYRHTQFDSKKLKLRVNYRYQLVAAAVILPFFFVAARGLDQKGLSPKHAAQYVDPDEISMVTNTTFTIIHSLLNRQLEDVVFMPQEEAESIVPVYHGPQEVDYPFELPAEKPNVVVILMESFSKEYIGYFHNGEGYTPFLDGLMKKSIVFTDAFANGKHSIDVIPSVCLGLPPLMNDAFVTTPYFNNDMEGMGNYLKAAGYETYFFHGGTNGSLQFDQFVKRVGFTDYYGRTEYGNERDFDGNWGIFDEPFFQFMADELDKKEEPFAAVTFSLSSHHPFTIPEEHKGKFKKGPLLIHEPVGYSDYALEQFFKKASTQDWYENTIFIITADHTGPVFRDEYKNRVGHYAVPIVVYAPAAEVHQEIDYTVQQTDILPTVLDLAGFEGNYTAFGNNLFDENTFRFSINERSNIYQIISGGYALHFDGKQTIGLYHYKTDRMLRQNLKGKGLKEEALLEEKLKAAIQNFRHVLIHNQLVAK